jgi:hypothetical protein
LTFLAAAIASGSNSSTLNDVEPGVLGFLVVAGMGIILYFLLRSMNKQFKKLGPPPEETDAESVLARPVSPDQPAPTDLPADPGRPPRAGQAGELQGNVQTGDAKQDEKSQDTAKRK